MTIPQPFRYSRVSADKAGNKKGDKDIYLIYKVFINKTLYLK
jgi:hypothetical protein